MGGSGELVRSKKLDWAFKLVMALITLVAVPTVGWSLTINTQMQTHLTAAQLRNEEYERRIASLESSKKELETRIRALEGSQADVRVIERDVEYMRASLQEIKEGVADLARGVHHQPG